MLLCRERNQYLTNHCLNMPDHIRVGLADHRDAVWRRGGCAVQRRAVPAGQRRGLAAGGGTGDEGKSATHTGGGAECVQTGTEQDNTQ